MSKRKTKPDRIGTLMAKINPRTLHWHSQCLMKTRTNMAKLLRKLGVDVPAAATQLWFTLYETPGVDRVDVRIDRSAWGDYPIVCCHDQCLTATTGCDKRLSKYIGKKVYVEVEYLKP